MNEHVWHVLLALVSGVSFIAIGMSSVKIWTLKNEVKCMKRSNRRMLHMTETAANRGCELRDRLERSRNYYKRTNKKLREELKVELKRRNHQPEGKKKRIIEL